jgi:uncharacterized OB-fold protein
MMDRYLPGCPLPDPGPDDAEFWAACSRHELAVQLCLACTTLRFPPRPICSKCTSSEMAWKPLSGEGTLYTFTVVHHIVEEAFVKRGPYNVAVVELTGTDGLRMISNVIDVSEEQLQIGMPLIVSWEDAPHEITLPRFRSAGLGGRA